MRKVIALLLTLLSLTFLISPANAAKTVFYLNLAKGCYAGTPAVTQPLKWSGPTYKTLYPKSCNGAHHYEVFYVGKLTSNLSDDAEAQGQAKSKCVSAARNYLANATVNENLSLAWFFPDAGTEERKYGKKLICFFRYTTQDSPDYSMVFYRPALQSA